MTVASGALTRIWRLARPVQWRLVRQVNATFLPGALEDLELDTREILDARLFEVGGLPPDTQPVHRRLAAGTALLSRTDLRRLPRALATSAARRP